MIYKIIRKEIFPDVEKGNPEYKILRITALSRDDRFIAKHGIIRYKLGNQGKAFQKIKRKLAIAFR